MSAPSLRVLANVVEDELAQREAFSGSNDNNDHQLVVAAAVVSEDSMSRSATDGDPLLVQHLQGKRAIAFADIGPRDLAQGLRSLIFIDDGDSDNNKEGENSREAQQQQQQQFSSIVAQQKSRLLDRLAGVDPFLVEQGVVFPKHECVPDHRLSNGGGLTTQQPRAADAQLVTFAYLAALGREFLQRRRQTLATAEAKLERQLAVVNATMMREGGRRRGRGE